MFHDASPLSSSIVLAVTHQGDLTALRDITGTRNVKGTQSVSSARGDFGPGADGTQPADNPLRVMGDNLRITTARSLSGHPLLVVINGEKLPQLLK